MPIGYLVTATPAAGCIFLAVTPLGRPSALGTLSFRCGILVDAFPFLVFYYLLASTALAFAEGDVDSPVGWVAFGIALLAALGLVVVVRRSSRTRSRVERALDDGLGADRPTREPARLPLGRVLLAPFLVRRRDVERIANISYGDAGRSNLLDVYRHRSCPHRAPTLIHFHGGHFRSGRKNHEALPLLYRLASQGWVCISANYRLRPAFEFPDHHVDAKKVVAWAKERGRELGVDPGLVFVAGSSAGAHMASLAALTPNDPAFQPGFEHADTSVVAAIGLGGYYGYLGANSEPPSSPLAYGAAEAPPFFVAHGDLDTVVSPNGARALVEHLRETSSNPVVYAELPGAQHAFDLFHSIRFEAVIAGIEVFAASVRADRVPVGARL